MAQRRCPASMFGIVTRFCAAGNVDQPWFLDIRRKSLLYRAVSRDGDLKMPPGKSGLSAEELASIRAWIDAGAPWDNAGDKVESAWWSFRSPARPAIPKPRDATWIRNPIDAFILAKLEDKRLKPAPPASKLALVRRVYFDLHGLPPTPAEVDDFIQRHIARRVRKTRR